MHLLISLISYFIAKITHTNDAASLADSLNFGVMNYMHHDSISHSDFPIFLITAEKPWIKSLVLENFSQYQPMNQFCLGGQKTSHHS